MVSASSTASTAPPASRFTIRLCLSSVACSSQTNRLLDHATEERLRDMKSNDLFFNGANATEASLRSIRPMAMVKLYAPSPYEPGSSISHVDEDLYADIRTGLMAPIYFGAGTDRIDILTLGIVKDLGY